MTTTLAVVMALAAADFVVAGALLFIVGVDYHHLRKTARAEGKPPLPPATKQFVFLGSLAAAGVVAFAGCAWWLLFRSE